MNTQEAIRNLDAMSVALGKTANKPENYNTQWSHYLEQMSWQMHKMSNDLRDIESKFGLTY
jgi:hypothetical protein